MTIALTETCLIIPACVSTSPQPQHRIQAFSSEQTQSILIKGTGILTQPPGCFLHLCDKDIAFLLLLSQNNLHPWVNLHFKGECRRSPRISVKFSFHWGKTDVFICQKTNGVPSQGQTPARGRRGVRACTGGQVSLPPICFCKRLIPNVFQGGKHQPAAHVAAYNGKIFLAKDKKVRDAHHVHISPGKPC